MGGRSGPVPGLHSVNTGYLNPRPLIRAALTKCVQCVAPSGGAVFGSRRGEGGGAVGVIEEVMESQ